MTTVIGQLVAVGLVYLFVRVLQLTGLLSFLPPLPEPIAVATNAVRSAWDSLGAYWSIGGLLQLLGALALLAFLLYALPLLLLAFAPEQDLKKKYKAEWAFVTGGSSGLGRALSFKLASQGLDVIVCALPDKFLDETMAALRAAYPERAFVTVGVNLGSSNAEDYMAPIRAASAGKAVQVVFSNAGFVITRAFTKTEMPKLAANWACNITSHIHVAHHFMGAMQRDGLRGCLAFTSSHVAFMPSPANALYAASKAALTALAANLALEGAPYGIDVTVIQVGPMRTAFVANLAPLDAVKAFYKFSSSPEQVASVFVASVGRLAVRDHSLLGVVLRLLFRVLDTNWFLYILATFLPLTADWKNFPDLH